MSRGMSGSGGMMQPETPAASANPRPLAEVLAAIHASVSEADWETLAALQPEVAAHGGALVSELVSLLANAESLAAMETLAQILGATGDPAALPALHDLLSDTLKETARGYGTFHWNYVGALRNRTGVQRTGRLAAPP